MDKLKGPSIRMIYIYIILKYVIFQMIYTFEI